MSQRNYTKNYRHDQEIMTTVTNLTTQVTVLGGTLETLKTEFAYFKKEAKEKHDKLQEENDLLKNILGQQHFKVEELQKRLLKLELHQLAIIPEIEKAVENFNEDCDTATLREEMMSVLDENSTVYQQLESLNDDDFFSDICYEEGFAELLMVLLDAGLDVDEHYFEDEETLLHGVARSGFVQLAEILLDFGADLKERNANGDSPLIIAARQGHLEMVKCLVDHGDNVNIQMKGGWTCLHEAAKGNYLDIVKFLVSAGANVRSRSRGNRTPLSVAKIYKNYEVINYLQLQC